MDSTILLERAQRCGEWMLRNQVVDRLDANRGRGIQYYNFRSGALEWTAGWLTGIMTMGLCALHRRTQDERYRQAAEFAGHYLMSLQVLDSREKRYYGAFRELTPQSIEFAPRDATSAAWGLIWLYNLTGKAEYLDRALLFGEWHMEYGMHAGWPLYAFYMDPSLEDFYAQGSFQSGTGLFYHDLFIASGDARFIDRGLRPIASNYRDRFFRKDGSLVMERDAFTGRIVGEESPSQEGLGFMHLYNDDFGAAMLQAASDLFGDESYRETARHYALWLASVQRPDGTFPGGLECVSGVPVSLMYFNDLGGYYNDERLLRARDRALSKLLSLQCGRADDPRCDGAFAGGNGALPPGAEAEDEVVHMRTTGYALMALLKQESPLAPIWLGRHNPPFVDPLRKGTHRLVW